MKKISAYKWIINTKDYVFEAQELKSLINSGGVRIFIREFKI